MKTLVVAPHPDDEVLGVGGTLLRKKAEGGTIGWLIMTSMNVESGWSPKSVSKRKNEILFITFATKQRVVGALYYFKILKN